MNAIRVVIWLLYALVYAANALMAYRDNVDMHYPLGFIALSAATYACMLAGVVMHAMSVHADRVRLIWRWLTPAALVVFIAGTVMDAVVPSGINIINAPRAFVTGALIAVLMVTPAFIGNFRFAYSRSG